MSSPTLKILRPEKKSTALPYFHVFPAFFPVVFRVFSSQAKRAFSLRKDRVSHSQKGTGNITVRFFTHYMGD